MHGWRWRLTSIPEEDIPCVVARSRGPKWDVGDELARKFNLGEQYFAEISGYPCPLFLLTIPLSICMQLPYGLTMPTNSRPCPSTPTRPSKSPNEPTTDLARGRLKSGGNRNRDVSIIPGGNWQRPTELSTVDFNIHKNKSLTSLTEDVLLARVATAKPMRIVDRSLTHSVPAHDLLRGRGATP